MTLCLFLRRSFRFPLTFIYKECVACCIYNKKKKCTNYLLICIWLTCLDFTKSRTYKITEKQVRDFGFFFRSLQLQSFCSVCFPGDFQEAPSVWDQNVFLPTYAATLRSLLAARTLASLWANKSAASGDHQPSRSSSPTEVCQNGDAKPRH